MTLEYKTLSMTHISGFDYGTSNCAMGIMQDGKARLQALEGNKPFIPSTLYALHRDLIPEWISHNWASPPELLSTYQQSRQRALEQARHFRREEGVPQDEQSLFFGLAAFDEYLAMPEEGYFVKSPKSFLGSSGLQANAIAFFEDIVTAMMRHIKQQAERNLENSITHTVIGRPVNFQGMNSNKSNRQAEAILNTAARRAGFIHSEFLYEPLAAGIHFEDSLNKNCTVLVVDIGGGTTDCSMVKMGPSYKEKTERQADFLGHSGERIGGNDLDIAIAAYELMPLFGMQSLKKNKLPMPTQLYWNAVSTNDLAAQSAFYNEETRVLIDQLQRDAADPKLVTRLVKMREEKQNYHIVRSAEQCKITLSDQDNTEVDLAYIEQALSKPISQQTFREAINRPLEQMLSLMDEAISQAGTKPELIYITGGSAKSPVMIQAIRERIGDIDVVDGDHFGSVATGLTIWADRIFK